MSNAKLKALKSPNRGSMRVTMASRLMAGFYDQNKRNLKGSSVVGGGKLTDVIRPPQKLKLTNTAPGWMGISNVATSGRVTIAPATE